MAPGLFDVPLCPNLAARWGDKLLNDTEGETSVAHAAADALAMPVLIDHDAAEQSGFIAACSPVFPLLALWRYG